MQPAVGSPISSRVVTAVVARLAGEGIAVVDGFLPYTVITKLRAEGLRRDAAGLLAAAGTGRGAAREVHDDVRGDRIGWIDERAPTPPERALLAALEALRVAVNRELTLGLWRYEGHYALYPPGARYARHVDRFRDDDARSLSLVLYLNEAWRADDGGALRIGQRGGPARDVLPAGGTLVAFLAADFEHEVLPATRPRLAVAGWFRTRDATIQ
jgi:SM-20-related protein